AHVQQQAAVSQLNDFAFIALIGRCASAELPRLAVVVGVNDVRVADLARQLVVAGNDEAPLVLAAGELNASARAGGVPTPRLVLGFFGDFLWLGPRLAIVLRVADEDAPRIAAKAGLDFGFADVACVPGEE